MEVVVVTVLTLWTVVFAAAAFLPALLNLLGHRRSA
jgi:hypothetical protein